MPLRRLIAIGFIGLPLAGCVVRKPQGRMPVLLIPAPQSMPDAPLIIVLPGVGDDLEDLRASGIAAAIQRGWPRADVLLVGTTLGYYLHGGMARRLQDEIILPARVRGYRDIWLAGASMGGMGALLHARRYPGEVSGMVLLAPYMGDTRLIKTITADGGVLQWNPGPLPAKVDKKNYQIELWRVVHNWGLQPDTAQQVWLAAGASDRLLPVARLIAPTLPTGHFLELPGGHSWRVWDKAAVQIFTRIAERSVQAGAASRPGRHNR